MAVWNELIALGAAVRGTHVIDDARAVVCETIERSKHNIELIHHRLVNLGYQFANPEAAFVLAGPDQLGKIEKMESQLGTFPLLLRGWYEAMASVDFSQAPGQLRERTVPGDVNGLGSHPELIVQSLDRGWQGWLFYCQDIRENPHLGQPAESIALDPFWPTGGVAPSSDFVGFSLPNLDADGALYDDGREKIYFIRLLRRCFHWGGFPFCKYYAAGNVPLTDARPNFERIIPLLREGLRDL